MTVVPADLPAVGERRSRYNPTAQQTYLQGLGVRRFADKTDHGHLLTPAVVARRQVHRVFRAGPGCQNAGERYDTRRKAVSTPGTLGQLSNGESVSFRPRHKTLIYLKEADVRDQNFFWVDLASGQERQITEFRSGFEIRDFDIAPDGSRILFDRLRANSDVVLMDRDRRK